MMTTARERRGIAAGLALAGALVLVLAATRMNGARLGERERYADASARQRRAVAATRPQSDRPGPPRAGRPACVTGADGFATAVERAVVSWPVGGDGAARVATLLRISDLAVRAQREAELSRPAPTLPKRMGAGAEREACYARLVGSVTAPAGSASPPR